LRFNTACNAVRDRVPSLGRLDSVVITQRFPPQLQLEWLDDPRRSGGGNILHTGVHCFDMIRYLTGLEPATVSCRTRNVYTHATEDHFVSWLTFADSDALAMVTCSRATHSRNGLIEVAGDRGQLVGEHVLNRLYAIDAKGRSDVELGPPKHTALEALRWFVDDARTGAPPAVTYRDGLIAVAVADACYRAARSGRDEPVVMPDQQS
jgi:myo-inositol 2-dehydrogenase/D-chiro-inositol 1-dehydrogenase